MVKLAHSNFVQESKETENKYNKQIEPIGKLEERGRFKYIGRILKERDMWSTGKTGRIARELWFRERITKRMGKPRLPGTEEAVKHILKIRKHKRR